MLGADLVYGVKKGLVRGENGEVVNLLKDKREV